MKDNEFLLHVLADGRDHALTEILQRSIATRGHGLTVHSRAAELRKRGYTIQVSRVPGAERGRAYTYRWIVDEKHPVVDVLRAASLDESVSPPLLAMGGGIDGTSGGAARSALQEPSASQARGSTDGSRSTLSDGEPRAIEVPTAQEPVLPAAVCGELSSPSLSALSAAGEPSTTRCSAEQPAAPNALNAGEASSVPSHIRGTEREPAMTHVTEMSVGASPAFSAFVQPSLFDETVAA